MKHEGSTQLDEIQEQLERMEKRLTLLATPFWTLDECALYANVSHMTIRRLWENDDTFPAPVELTTGQGTGARPIKRWSAAAVRKWFIDASDEAEVA